jgi:protein SCO1/2
MLRTAVAALVIACAGSAALWHETDGFRAFTAEGARRLSILEQPRPVPNVRLIDMQGRELTLAEDIGRAVVVEFIYTTCPTLCVTLGESFAKLQDTIRTTGLSDRVRLVSISFDLVHDGPQALMDYAKAHGADGRVWIAARPESEQGLRALLQAFGVIVIPDGGGGFVHNAALHVIDRKGRLKMILDVGDEAQVLAAVRSEE